MANIKVKYDTKEAFYGSKVDIIIPFHGQESKVSKLVESIITLTHKTNSIRIILVDDASPSEKWGEIWKKVTGVTIIRNETQLGFGGSLYQGFLISDAPWVVFMHSDCVVETPKWLFEMGKSLVNFREKGMNVKMISAKTNNPGDYDERLKGVKNENGDDVIFKNSTLPLYCAMCNRKLFSKINGFIKNYPYALYEDEELAHRMRKHGYLQGVCGKSWVFHEGGATINSLSKSSKIKKIMESNKELYLSDVGQS
jgi:GT2 family glycosyltransferase